MKKINVIFICLICFLSLAVQSQNAPVTTAAVVTTATPGDHVVVPVTVSGFNNIGTISLTLDYDPAVLTYVSETHDPLFGDMSVSGATAGRITAGWYGASGITLPDGTTMFAVTFHYISGSSDLTWFDDGGSCEYSDGDANPLNDIPTSQYYINGFVTSQAAPVTHAPFITNAVPGNVIVPVTVDGFVNIGTISLTLEYDPLVLTFVSGAHNPAFTSDFTVSTAPGTGGKYNIIIGWFGSAVTLTNGSSLVDLTFTYTNSNGLVFSTLNWKDNGNSCEYGDASAEPLWDSPTADYYHNGLVAGQLSPITYLPFITNPPAGDLWIPLTVDNFTNIAGISLTFEYNPGMMTYANVFSSAISGLTVGSQILPNGNRKIVIGRIGNTVSLANGSTLVNIKFNYISGTSLLTFLDNGESCEYSDPDYYPLYDLPTADYYHNGVVTGQLSPVTHLPVITNATAGDLWVPVTVDNFDNIASLSLTFEYDPLVITYTNVFSPGLSGLNAGSQPIAGGKRKITIGWWAETPSSLPDGSQIVNLKFTYNMGTTLLDWSDNGGSCEYSDANYNPLYDIPTESFYHSGIVTSQLSPVIKADTTAGVLNGLVTVPIRVWGFANINSFSLTLDYNPDVITFECATPNTAVAESFDASDIIPGRLEIGWFGDETTLSDGSDLIYLTFLYHGGTSALTWHNDGATCQYTAGALYLPLYDLPTTDFYKNGRVIPSPAAAVWTGATSSDWTVPANWNDFPAHSFFDVIINATPTPPHWPKFTGDFAVGAQCKSLTLTGAAEMEVTGNMTIEPGRFFEMTGAGALKVGKDWNNYGIFEPGTGTVEFTGTADGNIDHGTYPATSLSSYTPSTFAAGMTALVGGTAGPTGDNAHSDVSIGFTFNYLGVDYTQLRINTNGWVSLNLSGNDATSGINSSLFFPVAPGTALAPWWDDLLADGGTAVSYQSSGGVFTAEWKNILAFSSEATARLNFQVKLYSGTNVIEFCYGSVAAGTHNTVEGASIGIKDATGGLGRFIEATSGSGYIAKTCLVSDTGWPAVNYRFSPPAGLGIEIFWKMVMSKTAGLNIKRDVKVNGH
jgi:hypothetical protein